MTKLKIKAADLVNNLYTSNRISTDEYITISSALDEIEPLDSRDKELENLWAQLEDVPMDPETERIDEPYLHFPSETHREEIWKWFDERYSRGISGLLYGDGVDRTPDISKLYHHKRLCGECFTEFCVFNSDDTCMFPMVSGRKPVIDDEGDCQDIAFEPNVSGCQ